MLRYLPIIAAVVFICNIVMIIYRINHWSISQDFAYACWGSLIALNIIMVYYTWHKTSNIPTTAMILWTFGILFISVLIIPWWFIRIYPRLVRALR